MSDCIVLPGALVRARTFDVEAPTAGRDVRCLATAVLAGWTLIDPLAWLVRDDLAFCPTELVANVAGHAGCASDVEGASRWASVVLRLWGLSRGPRQVCVEVGDECPTLPLDSPRPTEADLARELFSDEDNFPAPPCDDDEVAALAIGGRRLILCRALADRVFWRHAEGGKHVFRTFGLVRYAISSGVA